MGTKHIFGIVEILIAGSILVELFLGKTGLHGCGVYTRAENPRKYGQSIALKTGIFVLILVFYCFGPIAK